VNSSYCSSNDPANVSSCKKSGTYAANSSSTYQYLGSQFNISYIDGSGATGDYVTDTMTISGATIKNLQFGVGYNTTADGILGIGYQINEVQVGRLKQAAYANVPVALVEQSIISSAAYSLWLNDLSASTGSILFGGVDTARFSGVLATLPVEKFNGVNTAFFITLTGLSLAGTSIAAKQAQAVLLDSGSSLTYLPNAMTSAIYDSVGAQYDSTQGAAFVPCSLRGNTSTLDFTFTAPTIKVPMDEMVLDLTSATGQPVTFANGVQACLFGVVPAGTGTSVLGDTFLRSAYVVYDLQNNQISIAQTRFNATGSSVQEIGTGTSPVPGATVVASPVAATAGVGTTTVAAASGTAAAKNAAVRGVDVSIAALLAAGAVAVVLGAC